MSELQALSEFHRNLGRLKMDSDLWRIYSVPLIRELKILENREAHLFDATLEARYKHEYGEHSFPQLPKARIMVRHKSYEIYIRVMDSYLEDIKQRQEFLAKEFGGPE
ncbi:hypothetical protein [Croceimicrobium sp.]|uniref:hypothetical protein n=1 Tax=Croceimicrobium sp. TaxID=2828340 RepID=UPI003BAC2292